jgi:hypothetical protein
MRRSTLIIKQIADCAHWWKLFQKAQLRQPHNCALHPRNCWAHKYVFLFFDNVKLKILYCTMEISLPYIWADWFFCSRYFLKCNRCIFTLGRTTRVANEIEIIYRQISDFSYRFSVSIKSHPTTDRIYKRGCQALRFPLYIYVPVLRACRRPAKALTIFMLNQFLDWVIFTWDWFKTLISTLETFFFFFSVNRLIVAGIFKSYTNSPDLRCVCIKFRFVFVPLSSWQWFWLIYIMDKILHIN